MAKQEPNLKQNPLEQLQGIINPERVKEQTKRTGRPPIEDKPTVETYALKLDPELIERFKDWAWTERLSIQDAGNKMFREYLADKEILEGRPRPAKRTWKRIREESEG